MASDNPTRTVALFCWILDVSDHPFPVDIEDSRTVGHLKKNILRENPSASANVDAFELTLWKVFSFLRFDQFLGYMPTFARVLSRSTGASRRKSLNATFSTKTRCWRQIFCPTISLIPDPTRK